MAGVWSRHAAVEFLSAWDEPLEARLRAAAEREVDLYGDPAES